MAAPGQYLGDEVDGGDDALAGALAEDLPKNPKIQKSENPNINNPYFPFKGM